MWGALTVASALVAAAGFTLADNVANEGLYARPSPLARCW